ncbi:TonB-dependent receptor [Massilia norwichensis]|uniref:TonB-dependent receptor n=1 Tax=Massilia norwichensis TaxID=1442366 RepID=A0ABT2A721_9BURK|nr:TonB-dependent receptor [Massilia norwichensis]MCS0589994.1 TonB-dependent receptor [Massilia norwichensis]
MRLTEKKMLLNRSAISTAVLLAIYGGAIGIAHAQEGADNGAAAAAPATAPAAASASDNINQVVVTARRRAELIQDVPGAVTAISGAELEKSAIPDITALTDTVPNTTLKASRGTNTTLTAFIRGIGQQDPVAGYEQGVGIYLDDVYLARPQGALTDIYDLERIEVLRGPQGTLYGRNTIGGAVKYVTRKLAPKPTLDAKVTIGNYGEKDLVLKGSMPISDILRIGATVGTFNRDGFGRNILNGRQNYNKDVMAGRVSLELTPTPDLFIRLATDKTVDDSEARQGQRLTAGPAPASIQPAPGTYDTRANLYTVLGHDQKVTTEGSSLLAEYTIDPTLSVKSITAYRKSKSYAPIDFDSLEVPLWEAPSFYKDNQTSQEFQLTYTGQKVQGVAGLFYMKTNAYNDFDVLYNAAGGLSLLTHDDIDSKTWAVYADASYSLTDAFSVTVGGRYTEDERRAEIFKATYLGLNSSPRLGNAAAVQFGAANTNLGKDDLHRTDKKFTPKLGFGYKLSPEHNVYTTWSKGFKGGMFDPRMDLSATGGPTSVVSLAKRAGVAPEEVSSVELGLKSSMNGGRLQTNAAVFYTDYKNVQIPGSIPTFDASGNVNGFAGSLTNAGKAKIKGLELEAVAYVTNQLSVNAMYSYIDAKYNEWMVANGAALVNIAGSTEFQNTPRNSANIAVNYEWPMTVMGRSGSFSLSNSVSYKSKVYQTEIARATGVASLDATIPGNLALAQDGFALWDAGLVWTSADRKIQVGLHGRNLTDKRYKTAGYNFSGFFNTVTAFYGDPRTVRGTVNVKF